MLVKVIGSNGYLVDKGGTEIPLKKSLTNPPTCDIINMFQGNEKFLKEVDIMANKKTVVQMYEEILALPNLTTEQKSFIEKRIEITMKKNANRSTSMTPKQKENEDIKTTILSAMSTAPKTIGEIAKGSDELLGYSNQKISALLTQLLKDEKVIRTTEKGKAYYSLPSAE